MGLARAAPAGAGFAIVPVEPPFPDGPSLMPAFEPFPQWRWNVPEFLNIGVACTDAHLGHARSPTRWR
jgi:hypothetical protein